MSMNPIKTELKDMYEKRGKEAMFRSKARWQGRNMVYPGPIDPYFLAVILIPEPHFPQNFDP